MQQHVYCTLNVMVGAILKKCRN